MKRRIFWLSCALLLPGLLMAREQKGPGNTEILSSSRDELVVRIRYPSPIVRQVQVDGETYHLVSIPGLATNAEPGTPELPIDGRLLAVPLGTLPRVDILDRKTEIIPNVHLPPAPEVRPQRQLDGKIQTEILREPGPVFQSDEPFPAVTAGIDEVRSIGGFRVARLALNPIRYRPQRRLLEVTSEITVRIRFEKATASAPSYGGMEAQVYRDALPATVLNPEQLATSALKPGFRSSAASVVADWYNPQQRYVKLLITEDGLYRLRRSDLQAVGFDVNADPRTFQIFLKGKQIPIRVEGEGDGRFDSGDVIEFYAEWNRGESEYFDAYSDTAVYWLTAGDTPGRRAGRIDGTPGTATELSVQTVQRHLEEDHVYHPGDNSQQLYETETVEGETWVWKYLRAGESLTIRFDVPKLAASSDPAAAGVRIRLRGTTTQYGSQADHKARIFLNDRPVGEIEFDDFNEAIFTASFPASYLRVGENFLKIVSEQTEVEINQFYVDWAEVRYPAPLEAVNDSLLVALPDDWEGERIALEITEFSSSDIRVYSITDSAWVEGVEITSGTQGARARYELLFVPDGRMIALTADRFLSPAAIVLDTPSDWRNPAYGADLLIISHRDFLPAAERLAEHRRQHDGLRVVVADVEDIYDEFNYGMRHPKAIKSFVANAVANWSRPAPRFLLLFGDTTWDVKMRGERSRKRDFVPTYGNPVSDNWFVALDGTDDFLPNLAVGRIPVETLDQALAVVEKIETYDAVPTAWWQKRFLFVNGGIYTWEHNVFRRASEAVINDFVTQPPASGLPVRFYRTSTERVVDLSMREEIIAAIDEGNVWMNVTGHAALTIFDVDFGRPSDLNNSPMFPFLTSMSCRTGLFADPQLTSVGEGYLIEPGRGAIAFWGTTGWGFISQDNILIHEFFRGVLADSLRAIGEGAAFAKLQLWRLYGGTSFNRHVINQYSLLGDPSQRLALRTRPDLTLWPTDIVFETDTPTESDSSLSITIRIRNYGLASTDSVEIEVVDEGPNGTRVLESRLVLPPVGLIDSTEVKMPLSGQAGLHEIAVRIDPRNRIDEADELNNEARRSVAVFVSTVAIARPVDGLVVNQTPELVVYNAFAQPGKKLQYEFEVDTLSTFDSPFLLRSGTIEEGDLVTRWQPPDLTEDRIYYLRSRTYDGSEYGVWAMSSFALEQNARGTRWQQADQGQFVQNSFYDAESSGTGVSLRLVPVVLRAESAGKNDGDLARLFVDGDQVRRGGRGHSLAVVSRATGELLKSGRFDTYSETRWADSLVVFLRDVADSDYVLAAIQDEGTVSMTEPAYQALESVGSQLTRQVGYRDSWALIGFKGARPGEAKEALSRRFEGPVAVADTFTYYPAQGTVRSPIIGPAVRWGKVSWQIDLPTQGTRASLAVLGYRKSTASWDTLAAGLLTGPIDLSGLDASQVPRLRLAATLYGDQGRETPVLRWWRVEFDPAADLAVSPGIVAQDTLGEGDSTPVVVRVANLGYATATKFTVRFFYEHPDSGQVPFATRVVETLASDEFTEVRATFSPGRLTGSIMLRVTADPADSLAELSELNNSASRSVYVQADTIQPVLRLTVDGKTISDGDFVAPEPEIVVRVEDNAPFSLADTTRIDVLLDDVRLPFGGVESPLQLLPGGSEEGGRERARVVIRPRLEEGEHTLTVMARDLRGNLATKRVEFVVSSRFDLREVMNYPNPFSTSTSFTYRLSQPADQVTIRIYTISGKLIHRIDGAPNSADFNMVEWDGRDRDGDLLANGVYLYKITARRGNEMAEFIGRIAILR